jgi:hypothetical protein
LVMRQVDGLWVGASAHEKGAVAGVAIYRIE